MEGLSENLPRLEYPCPICISTKATKFSRGLTTDVSKFPPSFVLQMDFEFFNVESIRGFTSNFWIYVMLLCTPLYFHPEAKVRLFISSNFLPLH